MSTKVNEDRLILLVMRARRGDDDAFDEILKILTPKIRTMCNRYFLPGYEPDDIFQVASWALYQAIKVFDEKFKNSFENFALKTCIERRLKTLFSHSIRQKFQPLNQSISWDTPVVVDGDPDDSGQHIGDFIESDDKTPLEQLIEQEKSEYLHKAIYDGLTGLETDVLRLLEEEEQYRDIARLLRRNTKCVDNSLVRARKKVRKRFEGCEDISIDGIIEFYKQALMESGDEDELQNRPE